MSQAFVDGLLVSQAFTGGLLVSQAFVGGLLVSQAFAGGLLVSQGIIILDCYCLKVLLSWTVNVSGLYWWTVSVSGYHSPSCHFFVTYLVYKIYFY